MILKNVMNIMESIYEHEDILKKIRKRYILSKRDG